MNRFILDGTKYRILAAQSGKAREAKNYDGDTATGQARDEVTGLPLWSVDLVLATDTETDTVRVKFPAAVSPDFVNLKPVTVEGLRATVVRERVYFAAASVTAAPANSKGDA
jgi:hypothetical protein